MVSYYKHTQSWEGWILLYPSKTPWKVINFRIMAPVRSLFKLNLYLGNVEQRHYCNENLSTFPKLRCVPRNTIKDVKQIHGYQKLSCYCIGFKMKEHHYRVQYYVVTSCVSHDCKHMLEIITFPENYIFPGCYPNIPTYNLKKSKLT